MRVVKMGPANSEITAFLPFRLTNCRSVDDAGKSALAREVSSAVSSGVELGPVSAEA